MFTGIVEEVGTVVAVDAGKDSARLSIRAARVLEDVAAGDSIAVNGCCLTVADLDGELWSADVMRQTLAMTSLRDLAPGDPVNLERAVTLATRLGGHLVQGHVDGVGRVVARTPGERWELLEVSLPDGLSRYLVDQGSITVDGVSLTVVEVGERGFTVSLIPETLARTTLGVRKVGDPVNLEVDVLAKYVERLLGARTGGGR